MHRQRDQRRVLRLVTSSALLALFVLPASAIASPVAAAPPVADYATVSVARISPAISLPRQPVTISGTVRNGGAAPITSPAVRAFVGSQPLATRDAVSQWADSTVEPQLLSEGARFSLAAPLGPGRSAAFTLTLPAAAIPHRESFAALPLFVDVVGAVSDGASSTGLSPGETQRLGSLHTFLPTLSSVKAYEPFSIAWLVPLTLDPDPALFGTDSPARTAAWTAAIGPGSRLDRVITGTDSWKVTWAVDPAVLGPPRPSTTGAPAPAPTASATPRPGTGSTDGTASAGSPDQVTPLTTALAERLRAASSRHTLWSLPYADPDLTALLPLKSGISTVQAAINNSATLDATIGPTRADVAWPVAGPLITGSEAQLRAAYSPRGLSAVVTSASDLANNSGHTPDASRRSSDGLPVLAYDEALSRTFTQTSSATTGAAAIQRFLADSLALLGERPGTRDRSVLVAAPRTFAGDPAVLASFFAAIGDAPWLVPTTTDQLLTASKLATPEPPGAVTTAKPTVPPASPTPVPVVGTPPPADPLLPGASPLTAGRLAAISRTKSAVTGIASIRDDPEPFRTRWTDAQNQEVSVRWRDHARDLTAIDTATQAAIHSISQGVSVAPSSVNFFADKGVMQITVVNNLDVPVHGVRLTLTPGQPRLRIEQQPGPLRIGAKSRTNVQLRITAVAAGLVPVKAALTTPNGTPLGQNARVNVRVQPTGTWIYWVLGGVAGVILVLGTYRSIRRGTTRASSPAPEVISLDV